MFESANMIVKVNPLHESVCVCVCFAVKAQHSTFFYDLLLATINEISKIYVVQMSVVQPYKNNYKNEKMRRKRKEIEACFEAIKQV